MADVIRLLEHIGQDAGLRRAPLGLALTEAQIDPAIQEAIQNADQRLLEALLGAQPNVFCGQHPAREDEEKEGEEPQEQDDDDKQDDEAPKSFRAATPRAASGF
jgi:hypothetical protein